MQHAINKICFPIDYVLTFLPLVSKLVSTCVTRGWALDNWGVGTRCGFWLITNVGVFDVGRSIDKTCAPLEGVIEILGWETMFAQKVRV
jgi:hypothetical protein